jgi:hypothetical protein
MSRRAFALLLNAIKREFICALPVLDDEAAMRALAIPDSDLGGLFAELAAQDRKTRTQEGDITIARKWLREHRPDLIRPPVIDGVSQ